MTITFPLKSTTILRAAIADDLTFLSSVKNPDPSQLSAIWREILQKNPKIALDNTLRDIVWDSLISILKS